MTTTRKQYSPKSKARVAVEAIRGEKTLNQLAGHFRVHPVQIAHWRKTAIEQIDDLFVDGRGRGRIYPTREEGAGCRRRPGGAVRADWPAEGGAGLA